MPNSNTNNVGEQTTQNNNAQNNLPETTVVLKYCKSLLM